MGLTSEMREAMDSWFRVMKLKVEMMVKLDTFCSKMEERRQKLEAENITLKGKLELMDRYGHEECLKIHNILISDNEDPEK